MVLRVSLYSSQSPWSNSDNPYTHNSLPRGTQTIPLLITVCLVALRLSLYSSLSTWWLRQAIYSSQFPRWYSDYPYTRHSLSGGTQTIPILITVSLVVLSLSYPHHILFGGTQSIPIRITVSLVVLRISLYSSESPWWYSEYLYTHHSLPGGPQTIPILIKVSLRVLRLSLYSSQSTWWLRQSLYSS